MVSSHGLRQNNKHTAVTHGEQVAYVRLLKEAIQGGASSGVVEPVRGIMLCYMRGWYTRTARPPPGPTHQNLRI